MRAGIAWLPFLLFLVGANNYCYAQERKINYFDIITEDSVVLYFRNDGAFCPLTCSGFSRNTRLTSDVKFDGRFADFRRADGSLSATGVYAHGRKHGFFESFYSDGRNESKGTFENNRPAGDWSFYSGNGILERLVRCTGNDTLLITMVTPKGVISVQNGEGNMRGRINLRIKGKPEFFFEARGKIKGGKQDGVWKISFNGGIDAFKETWKDGHFLHGQIVENTPNPFRNDKINYRHTQIALFLEPEYVQLERFRVEDCDR